MRVNAVMLAMVAALSTIPSVWAEDKASKNEKSGSAIDISVEPQQWQIRRSETAKAFNAYYRSGGKDKAAATKVDAILTNIKKNPWSITPMEAMDIYGAFYVPNEGDKNMGAILQMVSMFAIVGLYDTFRFADASARAEIINNEGFLKRPFTLGGEAGVKQLAAFLQQYPKEAEAAVSAGADKAAKLAELAQYDVQWPTAYGLTRMTCAMQGKKNCSPPEALPKDKWNQVFNEAVQTVTRYYRDNSRK